jgi:hypothetical protein
MNVGLNAKDARWRKEIAKRKHKDHKAVSKEQRVESRE